MSNIIEEYNTARRHAEEPEAIDRASELTWEMLRDHLVEHNVSERRYTYVNVHSLARHQPFVFKNTDTLFAPFSVRSGAPHDRDGWEPITPHTLVELTHPRGGKMTLHLLPPVTKDGPHAGCVNPVDLDSVLSKEAGVNELTALLPDLPPAVLDAKTMRGFRPSLLTVTESAGVPTPIACSGKPVATINKWLKRYDLPPIDTERSNRWLADISTALAAREFTVEWIPSDVSISEVYSDWEGEDAEDAPELGSCMSGNSSSFFEIYDDLQHAGQLTMMLIKDRGLHCGRALVWRDNNELYLDRVYCIRTNSCFPQKAIDAVKQFLADEGIEKCVYSTDGFSMHLINRHLTISLPRGSHYDYAPYVDSLRYWYNDNRLSSSSNRSSFLIAELTRTDGEIEFNDEEEEEVMVDTIDGCSVPEGEAVYLPRYNGYAVLCDTTRTHWSGRILECDVAYLSHEFYAEDQRTAHDDDCVVSFGGRLILRHDAVYVDGFYRHHTECERDYATGGDWVLIGSIPNTDAVDTDATNTEA